MCGIVGYLGQKQALPFLLSGLERLEYRGYDSAGVCLQENQQLRIVKRKGPIKVLEADLQSLKFNSQLGIAHTRWATHGQPNEINAHPHYDCQHQIAVVHNGIIENFQALKQLLENEGHHLVSETDSEIIAHLIEKFYQGNLEEATLHALKLLEGTYGLAVISAQENKIIAARRGSPLILGIGHDEVFIASDVSAVVEYTKQVVYLKDGEIAVITPQGYQLQNIDGEDLQAQIEEIKWTVDQIEKDGFKHFMLKEIFEQPQTIANVLRGRLFSDQIKLSLHFNPRKVKKIIITACGTSWHSSLIGKYLIEKIAHLPVEVDYASEFRYREHLINPDDLLVVISQSGETADTLGALRAIPASETLGIINIVGSTISREVKSGIYLHAGPEIGVASTKAFTSQVASLILLALYLNKERTGNLDLELVKNLEDISRQVQIVLDQAKQIKKISQSLLSAKNLLYLGRGINFPVALEGALKLKEVSYIHAEGYPAAEMKHGPIALIDQNMFVVFIVNHGPIFEKIISNMQEVKARGGKIIVICDLENDVLKKLADFIILVPSTSEELSPLINIIPLQLLAYYVADAKGINVDKPRNLAKSVTVE